MRKIFISRKRWKNLEKRLADLEREQRRPVKVDASMIYQICKEESEKEMRRNGKSAFSC